MPIPNPATTPKPPPPTTPQEDWQNLGSVPLWFRQQQSGATKTTGEMMAMSPKEFYQAAAKPGPDNPYNYFMLDNPNLKNAPRVDYEIQRTNLPNEEYSVRWPDMNYWENPTRVARYNYLLNNAPKDWTPPEWMDKELIGTAYNYLAVMNEGKPWWEWKALPDKDPVNQYLAQMQLPPYEALLGPEKSTLDNPMPNEVIPDWNAMKKWQQAALTLFSTQPMQDRPEWTRGAFGQALTTGMVGGVIGGLIGGPAGAAIGLLAVSGGALYQNYTGKNIPVFSDLLNLMDYPAIAVEQLSGVGSQIADSDWQTVMDAWPEAWEAGKLGYETTGHNWAVNALAVLAGDDPAQKGYTWKLDEGLTEPQLIRGALGGAALSEARNRMIAGEDPYVVYADISDRFGFSGQINDFIYQSVLDPLNLAPFGFGRAGQGIGKATGNIRMADAFGRNVGKAWIDILPPGLQQIVEVGAKKINPNWHASQGLISTLRDYRSMIRGGDFTGGATPVAPKDLSGFEKLIGGITPEGYLKDLQPRQHTTGIKGVAEYLRTLKPEAKAYAMTDILHKYISAMFNTTDSAPELATIIRQAGAMDPKSAGELGKQFLNSPELATVSAALRDFDKAGTLDTFVLQYESAAVQRGSLELLAKATGETTGKIIEDFTKDPDGLLTRIKANAQALKVLEASKTPVTVDGLKEILGIFTGKDYIPWDIREMKAQMAQALATHMDGWLVDRLGIKPDHWFFRLSNAMKSVQSLLLLNSPNYILGNTVNGITTKAAQGVGGFMTPNQVAKFTERWGQDSSRLTGEGVISHVAGDLSNKSKISAAKDTQDILGKVQNLIRKAKPLAVFSNISGKIEGLEGRAATAAGTIQMWNTLWRKGVGFTQMPAAVEAALNRNNPGMADMIYKAVEAGMNMNEITASLFEGAIKKEVNTYIEDAAKKRYPQSPEIGVQLFKVTMLDQEMATMLKDATTDAQIDAVFDIMEDRVQDVIDATIGANLEARGQEVAELVKQNGWPAAMELFAEAQQRIMERWLEHYQKAHDLGERTINMSYERAHAEWRRFNRAESKSWEIINAFEMQTLAGIVKSIGMESPESQGFISKTKMLQDSWRTFFDGYDIDIRSGRRIPDKGILVDNSYRRHIDGKNDILRKYHERNYTSKAARKAARDRAFAEIKELAHEQQIYAKGLQDEIDVLFAGMFEDFSGKPAQDALIWRQNVERIRQEMYENMDTFQDKILPVTDLVKRNKMWDDFTQGYYNKMITQLKQTEIQGARDLAIGKRKPGTSPTGTPPTTPTPQQPGDTGVMITSGMRRKLLELGYDQAAVDSMSHEQAWEIVKRSKPANAEAATGMSAEINTEAMANQIQADIAEADILSEAEITRAKAEISAEAVVTRSMVYEQYKATGLSPDEVNASMYLWDLLADKWSVENGFEKGSKEGRDQYYARHISKVVRTDYQTTEHARRQQFQLFQSGSSTIRNWYYSKMIKTIEEVLPDIIEEVTTPDVIEVPERVTKGNVVEIPSGPKDMAIGETRQQGNYTWERLSETKWRKSSQDTVLPAKIKKGETRTNVQELRRMMKEAGVTQAELDWTGMDKWLTDYENNPGNKTIPLLKKYITDAIDRNEIHPLEVEVTRLGKEDYYGVWKRAGLLNTADNPDLWDGLVDMVYDETMKEMEPPPNYQNSTFEERRKWLQDNVNDDFWQEVAENDWDYAQQATDGQNAYGPQMEARDFIFEGAYKRRKDTEFEGYQTVPGDNYAEYTFHLDSASQKLLGGVYHAPHFGSSNLSQQLLLHVRTNDITVKIDGEYKRILNVLEIQSDWSQAIEKYGALNKETQAKVRKLKNQWTNLKNAKLAIDKYVKEINDATETKTIYTRAVSLLKKAVKEIGDTEKNARAMESAEEYAKRASEIYAIREKLKNNYDKLSEKTKKQRYDSKSDAAAIQKTYREAIAYERASDMVGLHFSETHISDAVVENGATPFMIEDIWDQAKGLGINPFDRMAERIQNRAIRDLNQTVKNQTQAITDSIADAYDTVQLSAPEAMQDVTFMNDTDRMSELTEATPKIEKMIADIDIELAYTKSMIIDNPFSARYLDLAIKNMIFNAAMNGYDGISLTNAEMQYHQWGSEKFAWEPAKPVINPAVHGKGAYNMYQQAQIGDAHVWVTDLNPPYEADTLISGMGLPESRALEFLDWVTKERDDYLPGNTRDDTFEWIDERYGFERYVINEAPAMNRYELVDDVMGNDPLLYAGEYKELGTAAEQKAQIMKDLFDQQDRMDFERWTRDNSRNELVTYINDGGAERPIHLRKLPLTYMDGGIEALAQVMGEDAVSVGVPESIAYHREWVAELIRDEGPDTSSKIELDNLEEWLKNPTDEPVEIHTLNDQGEPVVTQFRKISEKTAETVDAGEPTFEIRARGQDWESNWGSDPDEQPFVDFETQREMLQDELDPESEVADNYLAFISDTTNTDAELIIPAFEPDANGNPYDLVIVRRKGTATTGEFFSIPARDWETGESNVKIVRAKNIESLISQIADNSNGEYDAGQLREWNNKNMGELDTAFKTNQALEIIYTGEDGDAMHIGRPDPANVYQFGGASQFGGWTENVGDLVAQANQHGLLQSSKGYFSNVDELMPLVRKSFMSEEMTERKVRATAERIMGRIKKGTKGGLYLPRYEGMKAFYDQKATDKLVDFGSRYGLEPTNIEIESAFWKDNKHGTEHVKANLPAYMFKENAKTKTLIDGFELFQKPDGSKYTAAEMTKKLNDVGMISNGDILEILGSRRHPQYLDSVINFMTEQRKKLLGGQMTPRDLAKAMLLNAASQRASEITLDTFRTKMQAAGIDMNIPNEYVITKMVDGKPVKYIRPEDAMAAWLMSENGKAALDAVESGQYSEDIFDQARQVRKIYGSDTITKNNILGPVGNGKYNMSNVAELTDMINEIGIRIKSQPADLRGYKKVYHYGETKIKEFEARTEGTWFTSSPNGEQTAKGSVANIRYINENALKLAGQKEVGPLYGGPKSITAAIKEMGYDGIKIKNADGDWHYTIFDKENILENPNATNELSALISKVNGASVGKEGFVKHMLGMGDSPTIDAVEISTWLTGQGTTRNIDTIQAEMIRDMAQMNINNYNETVQFLKNNIRERMYEIRNMDVGAEIPAESFAHIMHHWLWDRAKGTLTTHEGMYDALRLAQMDGIEPKGSTSFDALGRAAISLFERGDISTVVHEMAHVFRRDLKPDDLDAIAKWGGLKDGAEYLRLQRQFDAGTISDADYTRYEAAEEAFAKGFERHLTEPNPNIPPKMTSVFQKFSDWIKEIYRTVSRKLGHGSTDADIYANTSLGSADINAMVRTDSGKMVKIREIYDRMLFDDEMIEIRKSKAQTIAQAPTGNATKSFMVTDPTRAIPLVYKLVEMEDLLMSHTPEYNPTPGYPQELQNKFKINVPQVEGYANGLATDALLEPTTAFDQGSIIINTDGSVISGNHRAMAIRLATILNNGQYDGYLSKLKTRLLDYGLQEQDIASMERPVLVRMIADKNVDILELVKDANKPGKADLTTLENAVQDAGTIKDEWIAGIEVPEGKPLTAAFDYANNESVRSLIAGFIERMNDEERRTVITETGELTEIGANRLANALLARTYGNNPKGLRMIEIMTNDSIDMPEGMQNIKKALLATLGDTAALEAKIRTGETSQEYSITDDIAAAVVKYYDIKKAGKMSVQDYVNSLELGKEDIDPFQKQVLLVLAKNVKSYGRLRSVIGEYARAVVNMPAQNQLSLDTLPRATKGEVMTAGVNKLQPDNQMTFETAEDAIRQNLQAGVGAEFTSTVGITKEKVILFQHGEHYVTEVYTKDGKEIAFIPVGFQGREIPTAKGVAHVYGLDPIDPGVWVYEINGQIMKSGKPGKPETNSLKQMPEVDPNADPQSEIWKLAAKYHLAAVDPNTGYRIGAFTENIKMRLIYYVKKWGTTPDKTRVRNFQDLTPEILGRSIAREQAFRAAQGELPGVEPAPPQAQQPEQAPQEGAGRPSDQPVPAGGMMGENPTADLPRNRYDGIPMDEVARRDLSPMFEDIRTQMKKDLRTPKQNIPAEVMPDVEAWLKQVRTEMAGTKLQATRYGERMRDQALLNYQQRTGFDDVANMLFPYQFWYTRSMMEWAARAIDKPAIIAMYARYRQKQKEMEQKGMPLRLKGKSRIPAPYLPDWMGGGLWTDPMRYILPLESFGQPLETLSRMKQTVARQAEENLYDMLENSAITKEELQLALDKHEGPAWEKAYAQAQEQTANETSDPMSLVNLVMQPALWITSPYYLATGQAEKMSPLPVTRTAMAYETALEGTILAPLGKLIGMAALPEKKVREALGISIFGQWGDYYVDRMLGNMATEDEYGPDATLKAMMEKSGPVYEEAVRRVREEISLRTPGMTAIYALKNDGNVGDFIKGLFQIFPASLLPEGELKQRNLQGVYNQAWVDFKAGDSQALNDFFEEYPEYAVRIAVNKDPKERLQNFLVNQIWEGYNELEWPDQNAAKQAMGQNFVTAFLSKETRDYSSIPIAELAMWAKMLKQEIPETPETKAVAQAPDALIPNIELYTPEEITAIKKYSDEKNAKFPNVGLLWDKYYTLPKDQQKGFMAQFPLMKQYLDWKKAYTAQHPELNNYFERNKEAYAEIEGGKTIDISNMDPMLLLQLLAIIYAGAGMGEGTTAALDDYYEQSGSTMDKQKFIEALLSTLETPQQ